ncbi:hypothetical protein LTR94_033616, partial [Friedmanniomyces endolithicus]
AEADLNAEEADAHVPDRQAGQARAMGVDQFGRRAAHAEIALVSPGRAKPEPGSQDITTLSLLSGTQFWVPGSSLRKAPEWRRRRFIDGDAPPARSGWPGRRRGPGPG